MSEEHNVKFNLEVDTTQAERQIRELNRLLTMYVALARRVGLPEDVMAAIARLQQLRIAIQMTYRSLMILYGATGPIGYLIGFGGMALAGLTLMDQLEIERRRY